MPGRLEEALILAVFSGINGWLTDTRVGFNTQGKWDINKVEKQGRTPLIASICEILSRAESFPELFPHV